MMNSLHLNRMDQIDDKIIVESKFNSFHYNSKLQPILDELEQNNTVSLTKFSSQIYQPDRILISSDQALNTTVADNTVAEEFYNTFTVKLPRPALEVKSIQLVRGSIPNAVVNIPDTETIFVYYKIPVGNIVTDPFNIDNLYMVRLLPSWYKPELNVSSPLYSFNRSFISYQDLADGLVNACLADPIYDSGIYPNKFFIPGDITLTYNASLNKFQMTGSDIQNYYYIAAGYLDTNLPVFFKNLQEASQNVDGYGAAVLPQQYQIDRSMNLRLGFVWDGANATVSAVCGPNNQTLAERFRPTLATACHPTSVSTAIYTADNYANLVYSNCCQVYSSIVSGSTTDTARNTNFLATIPMNAANLGVTYYNPVISNPLTKIMNQVYEIQISLYTDTNEAFQIPNNAIISLEFALTYL